MSLSDETLSPSGKEFMRGVYMSLPDETLS